MLCEKETELLRRVNQAERLLEGLEPSEEYIVSPEKLCAFFQAVENFPFNDDFRGLPTEVTKYAGYKVQYMLDLHGGSAARRSRIDFEIQANLATWFIFQFSGDFAKDTFIDVSGRSTLPFREMQKVHEILLTQREARKSRGFITPNGILRDIVLNLRHRVVAARAYRAEVLKRSLKKVESMVVMPKERLGEMNPSTWIKGIGVCVADLEAERTLSTMYDGKS